MLAILNRYSRVARYALFRFYWPARLLMHTLKEFWHGRHSLRAAAFALCLVGGCGPSYTEPDIKLQSRPPTRSAAQPETPSATPAPLATVEKPPASTTATASAAASGSVSGQASDIPVPAERSSSPAATARSAPERLPAAETGISGSNPLRPVEKNATKAPTKMAEPVPDNAGGTRWLATSSAPLDYWEVQYLNGQRIGVTHYRVEDVGSDRLKLTTNTTMQVTRSSQPIRQTVVVETYEQADGRVDSFYETLTSGQSVTKTEGSVSEGQLRLKTSGGGRDTTKQVAWPETSWGPSGVHQMLLRRPIQPGEVRIANVFLPQLHQIARVTMFARPAEDTPSPEGMLKDVVPIEALMQLEKQGIRVRLWADRNGVVHKTIWPEGLNASSFRVSREMAERFLAESQIELLSNTNAIKLVEPVVGADKARRIEFQIESSSRDPHLLFASEPNQVVRAKSAYLALVGVYRPTAEGVLPAEITSKQPVAADSAPSDMVRATDPSITALAEELAGDSRQPSSVAIQLNEGVFRTLRKQPFSKSFDNAYEVAQSRQGDCTEHAVLLTALLRNRQIPARVASGLLLRDSNAGPAFVYHMWTEAWLGDRWLPLDPLLGTVAGCDHIKFLHSSLDDANPFAAVLPVMTNLAKLKITVSELDAGP